MSLVINTNVSSLTAQNNLTKSQSALSQATERLSSGLKINSAKDNAAGFAISQRYTTQIGGLSQASANASDAINLAQTAGSALDQVTANLQAIRDLAVQSANGTYGDDDRKSIDQEVQQRLAEITRIANQTTFNGSKVLDGSMQTKSFQIGADVGQTISVNLGTSVKASAMGAIAQTSSGDISAAFSGAAGLTLKTGDLTVGGKSVLAGNYKDAASLATALNTAAASAGYTSTDGTQFATVSGNEISFSNSSGTAIALGGSKAGTVFGTGVTSVAAQGAAGTKDGTGVSTSVVSGMPTFNAITLKAGDFTIDTGSGAQDVTGTFKNVSELETAINNISSGLASDDGSGNLVLTNSAASTVTVAGGVAQDLGVDGVLAASGSAGDTVTSSAVASEVTSKANSYELSNGDLSISDGTNTTNITGSFSDATSLAAAISGAVTGLSATVDSTSGELDFTNSSANTLTFGGTLATTLGLTTVGAQTATSGTDGSATTTGVNSAVTATATTSLTLANDDLTINGKEITGDFKSIQDLVDQINSNGDLGVSAAVSGDGKGFALYSANDITASTNATGALGTTSLADSAATQSTTNSLQGSDVRSVDDANALISRVDVALKSVSDFAAQLGAVQNRFQSTISTLAAQTTNLQSSQSTIQDADFAAETAALSKAQVLQQAGISVLSQANSNPQQVLKLLQ